MAAVGILEVVLITQWGPTRIAGRSSTAQLLNRFAQSSMPVPVNVTFCGDEGALSIKAKAAVRRPSADGRKMTTTLHAAPGASDLFLQLSELTV